MSSGRNTIAEEYKATRAAREEKIRESWVNAMEARIVREELIKCHKSEGVNNYESCKHLSELYLDLMRANKVHGYKQIDLA